MSVIDEFLEDYKQKVPRYEKLAQICAHQCESGLKRKGLRALVTFRAKRLDSLAFKVESRALRKSYQTVEDIYRDILDLAGVRIALYFPKDKDEVDSFIRRNFNVEQIKDFPKSNDRSPYPKRFTGYVARHYRLRLKREGLSQKERSLTDDLIEVQVGSVLMHAWAEVEHDLVYKSTPGLLSQDEYAILDELNGLMHAGEIALERLQRAVKRRINTELRPFSNHYELSSFLHDYLQASRPQSNPQLPMGRTDVLFHFLQSIGFNSVSHLVPILEKCNLDQNHRALVQQIADQIISKNSDYYRAYNEARLAVSRIDPFAAPHETLSCFSGKQSWGRFMNRWIALESLIDKFLTQEKTTIQKGFIPEATQLQRIRRLRDQILYGESWPSESETLQGEDFLQELARRLPSEHSCYQHVDG